MNKKILVADDEEILRMLITDTLEDLDCQVDEAEDGKIALEKIINEEYDLIILDYMMPEMTGIEVLKEIPKEKRKKSLVLMLTAKTQEKDHLEMNQAGTDFIMSKPFSPFELLEFIEEKLNG